MLQILIFNIFNIGNIGKDMLVNIGYVNKNLITI